MQKEPGASMLIVLPQQQKCTAAIKELDEINVCWNFHKLGLKGTPARKSQSYSRVKGVSKLSEIMWSLKSAATCSQDFLGKVFGWFPISSFQHILQDDKFVSNSDELTSLFSLWHY